MLCKGGRAASGPLPLFGPGGACAGRAQALGAFFCWGPRKPPALGLVPLCGVGALGLCGPAFPWDSNRILRRLFPREMGPMPTLSPVPTLARPPLAEHVWQEQHQPPSRTLLPAPRPADPWVSGVPASSQSGPRLSSGSIGLCQRSGLPLLSASGVTGRGLAPTWQQAPAGHTRQGCRGPTREGACPSPTWEVGVSPREVLCHTP